MTIRKLAMLLPAALFAVTMLAVQAPASADQTASAASASSHHVSQPDYDPVPESLGD